MGWGKAARRSGWVVMVCFALGGAARAGPGAGPPPQGDASTDNIRISGVVALPPDVARSAIGSPPGPGDDVEVWGARAVAGIVAAYQAQGFSYARAWFNPRFEPGVLWFDVDEGRVRVTFLGVGSVTASLLRVRLNIPNGIFRLPMLTRSLQDEKERLDLAELSYAVHELPGRSMTIFGDVVAERVLEISVVRKERFGWSLDISLSATWGVVPQVSYGRRDLFLLDDRLGLELGLAIPYRRYVLDADPKAQWVHGSLVTSYRLPRFTLIGLSMAPRFDSTLAFSRYERDELMLSQFYLLRFVATPGLVLFLPEVELTMGLGVDFAQVALRERISETPGQPSVPIPNDINSTRLLLRTTASYLPGTSWTRRDQRATLRLWADLCFPLEARLVATGQWVSVLGRHRLVVRSRGVVLAGNVPFWDHVQLAGDYQRTFFGDRYWVTQAIQVEIAHRIRLWSDAFEVGIFHDLSVFEDPSDRPNRAQVANSFGPSLNFLILDLYALGIYQGFGFAPGRFSQTLSFSLNRVF